MLNNFYNKPYFLISYFALWALAIWLVNSMLVVSFEGSWWMVVTISVLLVCMRFDAMFLAFFAAIFFTGQPLNTVLQSIIFLPLTFSVGVIAAVFIHNASHDQFRPRWLNTVFGECVGLLVRTNYAGWKLVHHFHHRYSDDPAKDPHSPGDSTFWPYTNSMQLRIIKYLDERHMERHQLPKAFYALTALIGTTVFVGIPFFWMLLIDPVHFASLWMPTAISGWWIFYVINFYSHPMNEDGLNEPVNLNRLWWQKLTNLIGFGVLYHKNHHQSAMHFNPKGVRKGG